MDLRARILQKPDYCSFHRNGSSQLSFIESKLYFDCLDVLRTPKIRSARLPWEILSCLHSITYRGTEELIPYYTYNRSF